MGQDLLADVKICVRVLKELLEELNNEEMQVAASRAAQDPPRVGEADRKLVRNTSEPVGPGQEGLRGAQPRQPQESGGYW